MFGSKLIQIENADGTKFTAEIIAGVNSKKEQKKYILFVTDSSYHNPVEMSVGYIYKDKNQMNLKLVENSEELNYVYSLISEVL